MGLPTLAADVSFTTNPGAAPTYESVVGDLLEFSMKRGRQDPLSEPETGVMNWRLRNQTRQYDPENSAGPHYGFLDPIKRGRLRATWSAVPYDLFVGDTEDWPQAWQARENTVPLVLLDGFDALNSAEVSIDRSSELSGARLGAILDAASWPAGERSIDAGQSLLQAETDLTTNTIRNALEMLKQVATSEQGIVFINGAGSFVFQDRHRRWKSPFTTVQAQFSNKPVSPELPFSDAEQDRSRNKIYNDVAIQVEGGSTYRSVESTSQGKFRKRSHSISVILSNPNEAQEMANYLIATYAYPVTRVTKIVLEPQLDDLLWPQALGREIGDRISVEVFPPGGGAATVIESTIEGVEHRYTVGRWTTTWQLSRADQNQYWVLGTSVLGTGTRVGY